MAILHRKSRGALEITLQFKNVSPQQEQDSNFQTRWRQLTSSHITITFQ